MGRRRIDARRIKIHRNYTVEEAAKSLGAHKNTIRGWIKQGLKTVDNRRPTLFRGGDLKTFITTCRQAGKQLCKPGELYCVKCREPRRPSGHTVDYLSFTPASGNLRGICPTCDTLMHRRVRKRDLEIICVELEVNFRTAGDA